jgi:hypothetical protein
MLVTVQIPDELSRLIPAGESLSRQLLEAFAADAYRNEKLSRHQVGQLLGLDRWQAEEFLAHHNAQRPFTFEDMELERRSGEVR